jgi:hypothetical protein
MGLCDTVKLVADKLYEVIPPERLRLRAAVEEIATMPEHLASRDLTGWDTSCGSALFDCEQDGWFDHSEESRARTDIHLFLVDELYELGRFNLYAAYIPESTKQEYQTLRTKFLSAGIQIPTVADVNLESW